jgi:hypothetical protein
LKIAARERQIESLSNVLLKKQRNFAVALLLQIEDDGATAKLPLRQDCFDLLKIFVLQGDFEKVVRIVDREDFNFPLSSKCVNLVSQEKCDVNWLFNTSERA